MSHLPLFNLGAPFLLQVDKVSREILKNSQVSAVEKMNFFSTMTRVRVFWLVFFSSSLPASLLICHIVNLFFSITCTQIPRLADPCNAPLLEGPATPGGCPCQHPPPWHTKRTSITDVPFAERGMKIKEVSKYLTSLYHNTTEYVEFKIYLLLFF